MRQWGWVGIQAFALLALLFFPFLIGQKSNRVTHVIPSLSGGMPESPVSPSPTKGLLKESSLENNAAFQSEVLQIQGPESDTWDAEDVIQSPFTQVRFEFASELRQKAEQEVRADRTPADAIGTEEMTEEKPEEGWFVTHFQRALGDGLWEDLTLLRDEAQRPVSSTFLELGEKQQVFRVKFRHRDSNDERVKSFAIVRSK